MRIFSQKFFRKSGFSVPNRSEMDSDMQINRATEVGSVRVKFEAKVLEMRNVSSVGQRLFLILRHRMFYVVARHKFGSYPIHMGPFCNFLQVA